MSKEGMTGRRTRAYAPLVLPFTFCQGAVPGERPLSGLTVGHDGVMLSWRRLHEGHALILSV